MVELNLIDGVRLSLKNGSWVLIRPSGTESYVRITLGGKTNLEAENLMDKSNEFINKLL